MLAPPETIQLGVPQTLLDGVTYSMPVLAAAGFVADPNSVLEVSMDASTWIAITPGADGTFFTYAPFIHSDGDDAVVILKNY